MSVLQDEINLFRNTAFKLFPQQVLDNLFQSMNTESNGQFEFPNIASRSTTPAILVIPIAIYSWFKDWTDGSHPTKIVICL